MKKLVLTTVLAAVALSATTANARVNLDVGIGLGQPAYVAPAPVYYPPPVYEPAPAYYGPPVLYPSYYNGRDRHRNYDWRYWHDRDPRWHR